MSPTSAVFAAAVGFDSVSVIGPNGCVWMATSNYGFITITAVSSGNGKVLYSVPGNATTSERIGTISITDEMFTII